MNITIHGVDITLTQEQIEKLQAKLEPKQTAKEFLLEILSKPFEVKLTGGYITYYQNGKWVFQQDLENMKLWVRWVSVWRVLSQTYSLKYSGIQSLIKEVVLKPLNCKGFTPDFAFTGYEPTVLEPLNCKGFTHYVPCPIQYYKNKHQ